MISPSAFSIYLLHPFSIYAFSICLLHLPFPPLLHLPSPPLLHPFSVYDFSTPRSPAYLSPIQVLPHQTQRNSGGMVNRSTMVSMLKAKLRLLSAAISRRKKLTRNMMCRAKSIWNCCLESLIFKLFQIFSIKIGKISARKKWAFFPLFTFDFSDQGQ